MQIQSNTGAVFGTTRPVHRRQTLTTAFPVFGQSAKTDPKPHWGWRNIKHALQTGAAALGALFTANMAGHDLVQPFRATPPGQVRPTRLEEAADVVKGSYLFLISLELLSLMSVTGKMVFTRSVRPKDLWAELHRRGITGKNLRIGVVDTGAVPTTGMTPERLEFYRMSRPWDRSKPSDPVGHGTAVANLIAEALPDSKVIAVSYENESLNNIGRKMGELLRQGMKNPESINMNAIREAHLDTVRSIADSVRLAVDKGADVVNVSLNPEQAVTFNLMLILGDMEAHRKWLKLFSVFSTSAEVEKEKLEEYYARLATVLLNKTGETLDNDLKTMYKPWFQVLDYAYRKGVPVVLGAGNDGSYDDRNKSNVFGNINPLGLIDHPALIIVGSTDHNGTVSQFTSEWNNERTPHLAGNGDGQIVTEAQLRRDESLSQLLLSPFGRFIRELQYETPQGTSFAAPDVTATYAMMKATNPNITVDQAKAILIKTAGPVQYAMRQAQGERKLITIDLVRQKAVAALNLKQTDDKVSITLDPALQPYRDQYLDQLRNNPKLAFPVTPTANGLEMALPSGLDPMAVKQQVFHMRSAWLRGFGYLFLPTEAEITAEMAQSLKRRVGAGTVQRLAAVEEAEKLRKP